MFSKLARWNAGLAFTVALAALAMAIAIPRACSR